MSEQLVVNQQIRTPLWPSRHLPKVKPYIGEADSLAGRIVSAATWGLISSACGRTLGLITSILVARRLGREAFGQFGVVISTVSLFSVYAGLGMGLTATKYVSQYRKTDPERAMRLLGSSFWLAVITSTIMALILFLLAGALATRTLNAPSLTPFLRLGAIIVFLTGINGVQLGALSGFERFRSIAAANLLGGSIGLPITIALTFRYRVFGALAGTIFTLTVTSIFNARELKKSAAGIYNWGSAKNWKQVLSFGVPVLLSSLASAPAAWVTNAVLINQPNGFSAMGIVGVADQWKQIINYIPLTVASSLLPVLSSLKGTSASRIALLQVSLAGAVAAVIAIPVAFAAPLILPIYGKSFEDGASVLALAAVSAILLAVANSSSLALQALGKPWLEASAYAVWGITLISASFLLVPRFKALGYVEAGMVSLAVQVLWQSALGWTVWKQQHTVPQQIAR